MGIGNGAWWFIEQVFLSASLLRLTIFFQVGLCYCYDNFCSMLAGMGLSSTQVYPIYPKSTHPADRSKFFWDQQINKLSIYFISENWMSWELKVEKVIHKLLIKRYLTQVGIHHPPSSVRIHPSFLDNLTYLPILLSVNLTLKQSLHEKNWKRSDISEDDDDD